MSFMFTFCNMWSTLKPSKRSWINTSRGFVIFHCSVNLIFYSLNHVSYNCIKKKYLAQFSMEGWEICQVENSLFRSLSKFLFTKHLPLLGARNLVLPDKGLLEESLGQWILNFKELLLTFTVEWCFPKKSYTNF